MLKPIHHCDWQDHHGARLQDHHGAKPYAPVQTRKVGVVETQEDVQARFFARPNSETSKKTSSVSEI